MSLTILIDQKRDDVAIVRWFLDPNVSISYATGPLIQMSCNDFRSRGWDLVCEHFKEYERVRLSEREAAPVFEHREEEVLLTGRNAIRIRLEESGDLTLIPQKFGSQTLAGLESLGKETRRTIARNSPPNVFWQVFDDVINVARRQG